MKADYQLQEIRYEGTTDENGVFVINYAGGMQVHFGKHLLVKTKETAEAYCKEVIRSINSYDDFIEGLQEISEGKGRYSLDNFEHARNTIDDMKEIATKLLNEASQK